jgi:DNA recombination protein RmuC
LPFLQFNQLKEQLLNDKTIFEKQLENSIIEKKPSVTKKRQPHPTFEKEVDFENLWERKGTKNEVEKLQDKFTKEFENLAKNIRRKV